MSAEDEDLSLYDRGRVKKTKALARDKGGVASRGRGRIARSKSAEKGEIARVYNRTGKAKTDRSAEAVAKVTSRHKSSKSVMDNVAYMTRNGKEEIEFSDGTATKGAQSTDVAMAKWEERLGAGKIKGIGMVVSAPKGTDPETWRNVSREWAEKTFGDVAAYGFVLHTDKAHPHVHLMIPAKTYAGGQLQIDRDDLKQMRVNLAEAARAHGIDMVATDLRAIQVDRTVPHGLDDKQLSRNFAEKQMLFKGELPVRLEQQLRRAVKAELAGQPMPDIARSEREITRVKELHRELAESYEKAASEHPDKADRLMKRVAEHTRIAKEESRLPSPMETLLKAAKDGLHDYRRSSEQEASPLARAYASAVVAELQPEWLAQTRAKDLGTLRAVVAQANRQREGEREL